MSGLIITLPWSHISPRPPGRHFIIFDVSPWSVLIDNGTCWPVRPFSLRLTSATQFCMEFLIARWANFSVFRIMLHVLCRFSSTPNPFANRFTGFQSVSELIAVLTFKCLSCAAPYYLAEPVPHLHTIEGFKGCSSTPSHSHCLARYGGTSFVAATPSIWNALPSKSCNSNLRFSFRWGLIKIVLKLSSRKIISIIFLISSQCWWFAE